MKAELDPRPDGSYDVILYDDARAPTRPHVYTRGLAGGGRLQRDGLLLHMPPTSWGKLHPVPPGKEGWIDPTDPRAPTARLEGPDAVVFHVPSNVPSHADRLRALHPAVAQASCPFQRFRVAAAEAIWTTLDAMNAALGVTQEPEPEYDVERVV